MSSTNFSTEKSIVVSINILEAISKHQDHISNNVKKAVMIMVANINVDEGGVEIKPIGQSGHLA